MRIAAPVAAVLLLAVAGGCSGGKKVDDAVQVSRGNCGVNWLHPHGGDQTIKLHNVGTVTMEVQLVDPASKGVYAEVESLAPNTTQPLTLVLGPGKYAFSCYPEDSDAETGPVTTIKDGPAVAAKAILPVSETDLTASVMGYRAHVTAGLATLAANAATLHASLVKDDRRQAEKDWLVANLAYNRLGAAYDTFGDSADAIDGLPDGLPGGVHDKDFTGLRSIEYGLWHNASLPALTALAAKLVSDVAGLRKDFGTERTDPNDLPLRSHEILENALQFELSGSADQGSGDELAVISANLEGTQFVLNAIEPVIKPRYANWDRVQQELGALRKLVAAQQHGSTWTSVAQLSTKEHEQLDGAMGQLLEDLAPIAAIGEVRRDQ